MTSRAFGAIQVLLDYDADGDLGVVDQLLDVLTTDDGGQGGMFAEALTVFVALLPPEDEAALYLQVDLCPVHHCDIQICADDDVAEVRPPPQPEGGPLMARCPYTDCRFDGTDEQVDDHRASGVHNDQPQAGSNL